mmetsp:Transcript_3347/g.2903  ORF Transcript_3347/g.2903 Transcript_3347/m.2903 type:complete len:128 (-) Transcript_3347:1495-1878(-)|eukprot:CAMPEP_0114576966 /NCGR_PEP_ID=MMETSP0125-20121206/1682_1 /TAXON_ID=485358 ORGANISM="Aristerostoma sp., Strain ATCC 50986" /NCGR_SAMPLE_ID=MMETSP0125 /ASSEMBLY_ACC=CAM_ASM_000245 /LENGTH=127 /DNA_ID=CAMNT_0001765917 /DNA_START=2593 /DNA_END=2976 /DNA_ORIENTATION=-
MKTPSLMRGYYSDSDADRVKVTFVKDKPQIGVDSFEFLKMISKGAFGRVWVVRRKETGDIYAMKIINLAEQDMKKDKKELDSLKKENLVYRKAQDDYVVRALFTFVHETFICFVMEYMIGGDFGEVL